MNQYLERLLKRVSHLEAGILALRAEIEEARQAQSGHVDERLGLLDGEEVDLGFKKLFQPLGLSARRQMAQYETVENLFFFSFPADSAETEVYAYQVRQPWQPDDKQDDAKILCVDVRNAGAASWLMMEIPFDWSRVQNFRRLSFGLYLRGNPASTLGLSLYMETEQGGQMTGYTTLETSETFGVASVDFELSDELKENILPDKPAKLQLHLDKIIDGRLDIGNIVAIGM